MTTSGQFRGRLRTASRGRRQHRLITTEKMGGTDFPPTHNEIVFEADGEKTVMTGTITYPSQEARDTAYATGMAEGMDVSFGRLAESA